MRGAKRVQTDNATLRDGSDTQPRRATIGERLRRPGWKLVAGVVLGILLGMSPPLARNLLSRLDFFRLRRVEVRGVRFLPADTVVARLHLDTLQSVWLDLGRVRRRLVGHPQIGAVRIGRRLPSTLVVDVTENLPVALVATRERMQPYDGAGHALPMDLPASGLDVPLLFSPDPVLLAVLDTLAKGAPALFARASSARRDGRDNAVLELDSLRVRIPLGVSARRLADIFPVESDLGRRGIHVAELDLRYRDQVIARPQ